MNLFADSGQSTRINEQLRRKTVLVVFVFDTTKYRLGESPPLISLSIDYLKGRSFRCYRHDGSANAAFTELFGESQITVDSRHGCRYCRGVRSNELFSIVKSSGE